MKKIIFTLVMLLAVCKFASADVYIIFDSESKSIYSVSQQDDTAIPKGKELKIIAGSIKGLGLAKNPIYYNYLDGEFILNNEKINADFQAKKDREEKEEDMKLIEKKMKELAYDALVVENVKFKKIKKKDLK